MGTPHPPGPDQRWRCGACGNLTRFDVARARRTVEFWHVDLAGSTTVEEDPAFGVLEAEPTVEGGESRGPGARRRRGRP